MESLDAALDAILSELPDRLTVETSGLRPAGAVPSRPARPSGRQPAPAARPARSRPVETPLSYAERATPGENKALSDIYASYAPQRIEIAGAVPHHTPLVESVAMAAVVPPMPAALPVLPPRLVGEGALSAAQLEAVIMAEEAHSRDLPGRFAVKEDWTEAEPAAEESVAFRQGFFIGDGTGVGKGRQGASVILSNWLCGRTKAVWISKSKTLIEDAVRDWTDLGGAPTDIQSIDKWKPDAPITLSRGILFVTYATLRATGKGGTTRLQQLVDWAGDGFDGAVIFDESHAMQNAAGSK